MYNQDEELLLAFINKNKIEKDIKAFGYNNYQAKKESDKVYSLSRRKYAIEFLKLNKNKLDGLSHADIANLLQALLSAGISIVDDELQYWLDMIENQVTHLVSNYIMLSGEQEDFEVNSRFSNSKKKFIKKTIEFSYDEVESLLEMLVSMKLVLQTKDFSAEENKEQRRNLEKIKYAEMVEKIIKKDLETRRAEEEKQKKAQEEVLEKEKAKKTQSYKKKSLEKQKNKSR